MEEDPVNGFGAAMTRLPRQANQLPVNKVLSSKGQIMILDERLDRVGLRREPVAPDGNCLYRALAHQLGCDWHDVKSKIFRTMRDNPNYRVQFEPEVLLDFDSFEDYIHTKYRGQGSEAWGGTPEIIVCCDVYDTTVAVFMYNSTVVLRGSKPDFQDPAASRLMRQICVAHVGGNHYDALVQSGDSLSPERRQRYCRELRVREQHSATELVRVVDLYEEACIYDIIRMLNLHTPEPYQLFIAAWAPGEITTYVLLDADAFESIVKEHRRLSVLVQPMNLNSRIQISPWLESRQPEASEDQLPILSPTARPPINSRPHSPARSGTPTPPSPGSPKGAGRCDGPGSPMNIIVSSGFDSPLRRSGRHDSLEWPSGIEPKGMIRFEGGPEEPLLFHDVLEHLRSKELAGQADESLSVYLTPTTVYATRVDGSIFVVWEIADCTVEQSKRKALDRQYFNLVYKAHKEMKVHLYSRDKYSANQFRTVVDFYAAGGGKKRGGLRGALGLPGGRPSAPQRSPVPDSRRLSDQTGSPPHRGSGRSPASSPRRPPPSPTGRLTDLARRIR